MRTRLFSWVFVLFHCCVLLLHPTIRAAAAGPQLDWARLIPNQCGVSGNAATDDSNGNIYVGSGPSAGLSKSDSEGNLLWTWGRQENDCAGHIWVRGISIDASENIYIFGSVSGNVIIGDFIHPQSWSSSFLAKMTPDRTIVFVKFADNLFGENR